MHGLAALVVGLGALGCSFERAPLSAAASVPAGSSGNGGSARGPGSGPPIPSVAQGDAGLPVSGAGGGDEPRDASAPAPDARSDATSASGGGGAAGAGAAPEPSHQDAALEDAALPPAEPAAPAELFSRCVTDFGCEEGLGCYGEGPGFCSERCESDDDCTDHQGIDFTCSSAEGSCRVDCGADGTDEACPAPLGCVAALTGSRCLLPREEGSGDRGAFEPCDRAHGDDDCADGLICYRSGESRIDGPGYCTEACSSSEDSCGDGLECSGTACRFSCAEGAECPDGMACEEHEGFAVCHYPP